VALVDGNVMFNRPGPRVVDAFEFLVGFLNDQDNAIPVDFPWKRLLPSQVPASDFSLPKPPPARNVKSMEVQIEEAHQAACDAQESFYKDPKTGLMVMTEFYIKKRSVCCGNVCRHCPYGHMNVKDSSRRSNTVQSPVVLKPPSSKRKKSNNGQDHNPEGDECIVMCWSGGKDSFLALMEIKRERPTAQAVLLTTINANTNSVPIQDVTSKEISEQAASLGLPVCFVPLPDNCPNEQYVEKIREALDTIASSIGLRPTTMVYGDLFLEDIRQWRVGMFHQTLQFPEIELAFPLWQRDYQQDLLPLLWNHLREQNAEVRISAVSDSLQSDATLTSDILTKGGIFHEETITSLPDKIDAMGENGEFHTYVKFHQL